MSITESEREHFAEVMGKIGTVSPRRFWPFRDEMKGSFWKIHVSIQLSLGSFVNVLRELDLV